MVASVAHAIPSPTRGKSDGGHSINNNNEQLRIIHLIPRVVGGENLQSRLGGGNSMIYLESL